MHSVTPARAIWLLVRLRMRRLLNQAFSMYGRRGKSAHWSLVLLIAALMTGVFTHMAWQSVQNIQSVLGDSLDDVLHALTLMLGVLWLASVLVPLASREIGQADWDLEWLVTLPATRGTVLWGRVLERTVTNPTGALALWPLPMMIAWEAGLRWSAPLAALAVAVPLLMLAALLRTIADTGLRLLLAPSQLRNLQALSSLVSIPLLYLAMSFSMPRATFGMSLVQHLPAWIMWTPLGLAVQALTARGSAGLLPALALAAETALLLAAGMWMLRRQLANGVVATGSRESSRNAPAPGRQRFAAIGTPLQRRELRLLSRDRNFLVQSLIVPIVVIGAQLFLNGSLDNIEQFGSNPRVLAAVAFGLGTYTLMLSAFQTINTEGQSLWMLYGLPRSLGSMLAEKAQLWTWLAMLYPLCVFGLGLRYAAVMDMELAMLMVLALCGMPLFALIAVSLGVWASNPLSQEAHTKLRPTYLYLYMLLSGLYSFALFTEEWPQRLAVVVLTVALAMALWQKARNRLPYLLDPDASPPAQVSAADGMMAALAFFVLQGLIFMLMHGDPRHPQLRDITVAFSGAGLIVFAFTRFIYWRSRTAGVPRLFKGSRPMDLVTGITLALPAIAAGAALLHFVQPAAPAFATQKSVWLFAVAVLAAPVCEEFIFRGLIFGGLRSLLGLWPAALLSAALFAVVHPPVSMPAVFVLGLCTALGYARSGSLLAPMLTHALYNGAILWLQFR